MHCTTTFHLYFIPLHIETKMSCFKGVYALRFFANCHLMKEIRKKIRKNGLGELYRAYYGYLLYFFHIKTMKIEQFMDYLDKNFSYWPQITL